MHPSKNIVKTIIKEFEPLMEKVSDVMNAYADKNYHEIKYHKGQEGGGYYPIHSGTIALFKDGGCDFVIRLKLTEKRHWVGDLDELEIWNEKGVNYVLYLDLEEPDKVSKKFVQPVFDMNKLDEYGDRIVNAFNSWLDYFEKL